MGIGGSLARPKNYAVVQGSATAMAHGNMEVLEGARTRIGNSGLHTGEENLKLLQKPLELATLHKLYQSFVRFTGTAMTSAGGKRGYV